MEILALFARVYWNARCRVSLTLDSQGRVLSGEAKRSMGVFSHGICRICHNDVGAYRAFEDGKSVCRISGCVVAPEVNFFAHRSW